MTYNSTSMSKEEAIFYRTAILKMPGFEGILGGDTGVNPVGEEVWEVAGEKQTDMIRVNCNVDFAECQLHPGSYICQAKLLKPIKLATSMGIMSAIIYCGKGPYKMILEKTEIIR